MTRSKRRMSAVEFESVLPFLRNTSNERLSAARNVLVHGMTQQEAGAPYGWTRQSVHDAVSVVWKALQDYQAAQRRSANLQVLLPPGWEQVTLIAPSSLIEAFRSQIAAYAASAPAFDGGKVGLPKRTPAKRKRQS